jgi:GTP pyrophosphokinase
MVSHASSAPPADCPSWLAGLESSLDEASLELLSRACHAAQEGYAQRRRASGEHYLTHALAVADILAGLQLDAETVAAALLHDIPEVAPPAAEQLESRFGPAVARLVAGVQKMSRLHMLRGERNDDGDVESLRKLLLTIEEDVRALLIRLAERVHDMRTLKHLPEPEQRRRAAQETIDLYAPLANRLGIGQLKWELEDLAFRHLDSATYRHIASLLDERRVDRERFIAEVVESLQQHLGEVAKGAEITGRPKHIFSIRRKMLRKGVDFEHIYDVRAVRVLVNTVTECYTALGVVHSLWPPIPGEFDDYIAKPKNNMYQSLHTAVVGPRGKALEVQIRTFDMHRHAELGVAAHWRYKEGGGDSDLDRTIEWLRRLLDPGESADPGDFMDRIKDALHYDTIHVFTPAGKVIDLPRGATPLDFAYHIHTEVGHRCRGAKVNGRIVPLVTRLENGQQVEILTAKRSVPSRDWLNSALGYLHTARARAKVRLWFKQEHFEENRRHGEGLLEGELRRLDLADFDRESLSRRFNFNQEDDFLSALGRGDVTLGQVVRSIQGSLRSQGRVPRPGRPASAAASTEVTLHGVDNLVTHFAKCCDPSPGDPIVGHITQSHGVAVHHRDCPSLRDCRPERLLEADWGRGARQELWQVRIGIEANDRPGLLRDVTNLVADQGIEVVSLNTATHPADGSVRMTLMVEVSDLSRISRLLTPLEKVPGVHGARRITKAG